MESEVHHVRARYNSQSLKQEGAVRVIQVKNLSELLALQKKQQMGIKGEWGKLHLKKTKPNPNIDPNSQQAFKGCKIV